MTSITWGTLKTEIETELDCLDEDFVSATEIMYYANDAIDEAEAIILKESPDYFLCKANLTVVSGTATVALPTGIWATKIRAIMYDDGSKRYELKRIKDPKSTHYTEIQSTERYVYMLTNDSSAGFKINLYPTPTVTTSTYFQCWYLRNANAISSTSTVIDVPEAKAFIKEYVKKRIVAKEGFPAGQVANIDVDRQRDLLIESLAQQVVDGDDCIAPDVSFYSDFDSEFNGGR